MIKNTKEWRKIIRAAQFSNWEEWERTFVFIPKADVKGKLVFGMAWKRERFGSVLGEYDSKTHMTPVYTVTDTAYANKKEVFIDKLQDKMQ